MNPLDFLILALATWRLSSLFVSERGPGIFKDKNGERIGLFESIRELNGVYQNTTNPRTELGKLLSCTWCFSVYVGTFLSVAYFLFGNIVIWLCLPLALSAGTIIVEKAIG